MKTILRMFYQIYAKLLLFSPINYLKILKIRNKESLMLNIGSGKVKIPNWINIDIEPGADLVIDVRKNLPFKDNTIEFIYNEHFIEHLEYEDSEKALKEFYRVLKKDAHLRIATPDLDYITKKYFEDWKNQNWLSWPEYHFIKTRGQMINISFRWWGHKYLYNEEDLTNLLKKAGFRKVRREKRNISKFPELVNLETRNDSNLVLEAKK
jgi:predicted SAM-dependent methyltransferase